MQSTAHAEPSDERSSSRAPIPLTRPNLMSWNAAHASSSPSSSLSASPVFSPTSPAYPSGLQSPPSKSHWQLSQSEPALALAQERDGDRDGDGDEEEEEKDEEDAPPPSPRKSKKRASNANNASNAKRARTFHVDIPDSIIGATRPLRDVDPVFSVGGTSRGSETASLTDTDGESYDDDSEEDNDDTEVEHRGRLSTRRLMRQSRIASSLPPSPSATAALLSASDSKRRDTSVSLHPPSYLICQATTDEACTNGPQCLFAENHLHRTPVIPPAARFKPASRALVRPQTPPFLGSPTSPRILDYSYEEYEDYHEEEEYADHDHRASPQSSPPQLDVLGLPPHPFVREMDLSQYRRAGSRSSQDSKAPSRGRRSRRASITGKYSVPVIPPFREPSAGQQGIDRATLAEPVSSGTINLLDVLLRTNSPPPPAKETPQTLYDSATSAVVIEPQAQTGLQSPPATPFPPHVPRPDNAVPDKERAKSKPRRQEGLFRGGALFANALAGLPSNKSPEHAQADHQEDEDGEEDGWHRPMFGNSMFSAMSSALPMNSGETLSSFLGGPVPRGSGRSTVPSTLDPVSPTQSAFTVKSSSTDRTTSTTFNPPSFTNPSRPLFSGYDQVVNTTKQDEAAPPSKVRVAEDWAQRQREKDLRQAGRLEKALVGKVALLNRRLDWKPPIVDTTGYGYGDGLEIKKEERLETGEILRVLTWDERIELEQAVKKVEDELTKVREEIVKHGGTPSNVVEATCKDSPVETAPQISPAPPIVEKGKGREATDMARMLLTPNTPAEISKREKLRGRILGNLQGPLTASRIRFMDSIIATATPEQLEQMANTVQQPIEPSTTPPLFPILPTRHDSTTPALAKTSIASNVSNAAPETHAPLLPGPAGSPPPLRTFIKKAAPVLTDDGELNPRPKPPPSRGSMISSGFYDMFSSGGLFGSRPQKLTEESVKLHQKLTSRPSPSSTPATDSVPAKHAPKELTSKATDKAKDARATSDRSMWASWGDSPLPGTAGASDGIGSPPFLHAKPRPASSVPPKDVLQQTAEVKTNRRISMSTAKPGEETSAQTMQELDFDDSSDEENADDSRDYVSAEEGFDLSSEKEDADPSPSSHGQTTLRERASTTSGSIVQPASAPERPSALDGWTFTFGARKQTRDGSASSTSATLAPGPTSQGGRHTPNQHYQQRHLRRSSQESANSHSTLFGYGGPAPNNSPNSPPSRRPGTISPSSARPPSQRFSVLRSPGSIEDRQFEAEPRTVPGSVDDAPLHDEPYFIVRRSANVIDEAANVIKYATARVMSGGVKIGSIQPRGVNGVILEEGDVEPTANNAYEDVDMTREFEDHGGSTGQLSRKASLPAQYPIGVPVPGQPYGVSSTSSPAFAVSPGQGSSTRSSSRLVQEQRPPTSLPIQASHTTIRPHLPSPVATASSSQAQIPPVEYCGDFRTTGHCRFGARCRYSHDVEPRTRTATTTRYRPSVSTTDPMVPSPQMTSAGIPTLPAGYQISNVLPQPHHIPGVPLVQQGPSPFVYAPAASIAHPLTHPSATAAANKGLPMANHQKAEMILKSMGISSTQLLAHQPAPTVMADGEISYDLTKGRGPPGVPIGDAPNIRYRQSKKADRGMEAREALLQMLASGEDMPRERMGTTAGQVAYGEDEEVWTVSRDRRRNESSAPESSREAARRRSSHYADPAQQPQSSRTRQQYPVAHHAGYGQASDHRGSQAPSQYAPVHQHGQPISHSAHGSYSPYQHHPANSTVDPRRLIAPTATTAPVATGVVPGQISQRDLLNALTIIGLAAQSAPSKPPASGGVAYPHHQGGHAQVDPRYPYGPHDMHHQNSH